MHRTAGLLALASLSALGLLAPRGASAAELDVVASFSILGDFARQVGGERISLTTLVGPGGDAHVYEPSPSDAVAVSRADVVLVNGLGFEGFLARLVETSRTEAVIVETSKGAELLAGGGHAKEHAEHSDGDHHAQAAEDGEHHAHAAKEDVGGVPADPHAWQSVPNARIYVRNIADAFCAADAEGCEVYRANADAYVSRLQALDEEIRRTVDAIPENQRVVITSHDAFGHFAREYGLTFLAPEGVSTESEASAADIAALITQVRSDRAAAIFLENVTNPRLMEQIASETGLRLGGSLYSDALSQEGGPAETYEAMMRYNIEAIRNAVAGS